MTVPARSIPAVTFDSTRFGPITVAEDRIISFVRAIPGFGRLRKFILIDHDQEGLFKWLQSAEDPTVAFLLTDPALHVPGAALPIKKSDIECLGVKDPRDLVTLVMVSASRERKEMSLNLKGPVVFNPSAMTAMQCIIEREDCPTDYVIRY